MKVGAASYVPAWNCAPEWSDHGQGGLRERRNRKRVGYMSVRVGLRMSEMADAAEGQQYAYKVEEVRVPGVVRSR